MQLECIKCHQPLAGKVLFCPYCGAPQNEAGNATATALPPPLSAPTANVQTNASDVAASGANAHVGPSQAASPIIAPKPSNSAPFTIPTAQPASPPPIPPQTPSPPVTRTSPPVAAAPPTPTTPTPEKKRSGCLGCAGIIVLALAIAGVGGYFYISHWFKQNELAALNRDAQSYIAAGEVVGAAAVIEKIRTLDDKSAFITQNNLKISTAKRNAAEAIKKSQATLRDRDLAAARASLANAIKFDRSNTSIAAQDTAIKSREKLRDQTLEAMRKCLSVNDFACGKTQANNAMRIDKSYDAMAEFTKAEVAYREAQNNPIQAGITTGLGTILEAAANAIVRAATDKSDPLPQAAPPSATPQNLPGNAPKSPKTGGSALPDCDQLILRSKNARQNRRFEEAVQAAETAVAYSPACEGAQEVLDAALTARRRAKQFGQ